MKLLSLSTKNFRLHAETNVTFEPEGVTGIIGTNEAGKSTLLEAMSWALFGAETLRGSKASIRWTRAKKPASVTLRFAVGGRTYRLERAEGGGTLTDETTGLCIAAGTKPLNQHVPTLLGMGHAEFAASFMCGQRDLGRIASMGDTERVAFIRDILGMSKIDDALKKCRARKGEVADELRGLEAGLGEREPFVQALSKADESARLAIDQARVRTREHDVAASAAADAALALEAVQVQKGQHDEAVVVLRDAEREQRAAAEALAGLEVRLNMQGRAAERLEVAAPQLARLPELRTERDLLRSAQQAVRERAMLTGLVADNERLTLELREEIAAAEQQVTFYLFNQHREASAAVADAALRFETVRGVRRAKLSRAEADRDQARREADLARRRLAKLEELGREADCPTCLRALGEAFATVLDSLRAQIDAAMGAAAAFDELAGSYAVPDDDEVYAEVVLEDAEKEVRRQRQLEQDALLGARNAAERQKQLAKAETDLVYARQRLDLLPDRHSDPARLRTVEAEIQAMENLDRTLNADRGLVSQTVETRVGHQEWNEKWKAAAVVALAAEHALKGLAFRPEEYDRMADLASRAQRLLQDTRVAMARAEEAEWQARAWMSASQVNLEGYDERAGQLTLRRQEHQLLEKTAARLADFRVAVATTIRPELEELMSGFVSLLTDGRHEAVTIDEDFRTTLYESGVPQEVVSGGTEDVVALAMRLAISQMIAERAGHPLSLLILDEPFGSLDETRRANVLALIRRLRGVFEQVVVISHVAETRDAVDHVIELEFDEGAGMTRVLLQEVAV